MALDKPIYTIGHSNHSTEHLIELLRQQGITCLVDVRSQPYSRWAPQFNREPLEQMIRAAGLTYHFMGDSIGGRPDDRSLYPPGEERPDYDQLKETPVYKKGIAELLTLARSQQVVIMCSEGDYRECHRHLLIAQTLLAEGITVIHIQPDGKTTDGTPTVSQLSFL